MVWDYERTKDESERFGGTPRELQHHFSNLHVHHRSKFLLSTHVSYCNVLAPSLIHDSSLALCHLQMEYAARSDLTRANTMRP